MTSQITIGPAFTMLQDIVYALPPRKVSVLALAVIQQSVDGSTWVDITGSATTGADAVGPFVRCHTGNTTMVAKV